MKGKWKRLLAAMLAASMIFGNAVPAYATETQPVVEVVEAETEVADEDAVLDEASEIENSDVTEETESGPVEETTEEEAEETESETMEETMEEETETEPVEEGDSEEVLIQEVVSEVSTAKTYDTVEDYSEYYYFNADESGYLSIEFFDSENFTECLDSAIETIVELTENLSGTELANVDIMIDDYNGNIPAKLWNALASYMNKSGNVNGKIMFHFRSSKGMYNKWSFRTNFTTVESDIDVQVTTTVSEHGIAVKFSNTTFPANSVRLFIQADSRDESLGKFETSFGKNYVDGGMDLEIWNNGAKLDHSVKYFYDSTGDCTELRIDDVQTLSADTYGIKAESGSESEIYTGTVEDKSIGKVLYISYEDVLSGTFSNSTIENALEARSKNNESYAQIAIIYPAGFSTTIPANIWNYIAGLSDTSMRPARFQFAGGNYVDWEWKPVCMRETLSPVALNGSFSVDAAELKGTLTLSDVDIIPADMVSLRISTSRGEGVTDYISGNKEDYSDIVTVFGTGSSDVEVYNNNSLVARGGYQQYGDDTGVNAVADFLINDVKEIGSGVYKVLKAAYGGEEFQWSDGTTCFGVFVSGFEKYGESFSEEALLEILTNKAGTTFDRVSLTLPEGTNSISKGIWNAAVALLNSENGENNWLNVSIPGEDHEVQWAFQNPLETNYEDDVSIGYEFKIAEKTIKFDQTEFPAEFVSWGMNTAKFDENIPETYEAMTQSFGTSTKYLDVMDEDYYRADSFRVAYKYDEDYGDGIIFVNIIISDLLEADAGMCYTLDRYHGSVNNRDERNVLFIDCDAMKNSLIEFNDDTLKEILSYWKEKEITFKRIQIQAPISYQSVSAEAWNAAEELLDKSFEERGIQINFYEKEAGTGFWFNKPEGTDKAVSLVGGLEFDKKIGKNEYRDMLEFENTDYPAEYVHWNYWADSDNESMKPTIDKLYNKFGAESTNVALYDAVGNSPENVGGHFNAEYGNGGSVHYNLGFGNIKNLPSKTMYGVWPSFYWGDISKQENGQVRLTIDPWNAGRDGKIFETNQIRERLKHHKEDFNQIEFVIPWSERNTIFADWIELAKEHLTPNKSGDFFVIFTFVNNEEEYVYEVWITNPGVGTTEDVTFECILAMDEETGVVNATVGQMSLDAGAVFIQYHGSSEYEGGFGNQLETYIGGNWDSCYPMTDVNFPQVEAAYRIYNGWHDRHFEIYNPNGFGEKESYQFAFELNEYVGKIRGEGTSEKELYIDINEFEVYGLEAKDDVLIDIITQYADDEVNWVVIDNYRDDIISKEVWNAAVDIMTGESQVIRIHQRASEEGLDWWLEKPSEASQNIPLTANFNFENKTVSFGYTDYPAEHIDCNYWTNNGDRDDDSADAKHQAMREAFGTRYTRISVLDENGNIIVDENKNEPVDLNGEYNVYAGENDYYDLNLNIWNIKNMTADTVYKLEARAYDGDFSWQEGDQTRLTFDYWSAWREDGIFTAKEIDRILGERNEKYNQIEFVIPWSENNQIYGEWIELANAYLTKNENGNRFVIFTFVNNEEEYTYEVWFTNPGLTQIDTVFNCDLSVDEETKTVNAKIGKIAVNAESAFIQYHGPSGRDDSFAQQMERTFGGGWNSFYQMFDVKYPKVETSYSIYDGWGGYDRHFEIYNPDCFDDKATYNHTFKLGTYNGTVYDGEDGEVHLYINMDDLDMYGLGKTDAALMNIFNNNAEYKFSRIELDNYPSKEVSEELWNAAVAALKNEDEQVLNIHVKAGEEGEDWWFAGPENTDKVVSLNTGTLNFNDGKATLSFSDIYYPADWVDWNYYTHNGDEDDQRIDEKHAAMRDIFGTAYTKVAVVNGENTACEGEYNVYTGDNGYLDLNVNIWNIGKLTSGISYTVEPRAYIGELEDGCLTINPRNAGKDEEFTLTEIENILKANENNDIHEIRFVISASEENIISKDIVNEVLGQTNFIKKDGQRVLKFHFVDFDERTDYEVCMVNPKAFEADVPVQVNLSINSEHIYADVNELAIPLEESNSEVYIRCYEDSEFGIGELIKEYFGIPNSDYYEFNSNVEHISAKYFCDENEHNSVIFEIYAGTIGFDQDYLYDDENGQNLEFELKPYLGKTFTDEGYYRLELKEYEANEVGLDFNDDTIIRALELRADDIERFDIVHIEYNHGECIDAVSDAVWNAAIPLFDDETENNRLEIHSSDDKGNGENWFFFNPYGAEYDLWLNNEVTIGGPGELAQVRFENTWYPAEHAQLSIWADYGNEDSNYKALRAAFGTDNGTFDLLDEEGDIWQNDGGEYYLNKDTDDEGKIHGFGFNVGNVNNLWTNYTYTMCSYTGDESEGCLFIDSWEAGKDGAAFTLGEIEEILKLRGDAEYEAIFVVQEESDQNKVDALIASKLSQRLADWAETTLIRYDFKHTDGSGVDILYLINPDRQSPLNGKNLVLNANFTWDADNNEAVVNIKGMDVNAEGVAVAFNPYYGDDLEKTDADKIKSAFGGMPYENYELKITGGTENYNSETVKAYYQKQNEGVYLEVGYTEDIDKEKTYRITRAEYIGEVMDFMDGTEALLINAWNAGKDDERLSDEEIAAIVAERVDAGDKFASVELLQPHTDENKISAAAANELLKLLQAPGEGNDLEETYLSFTFVELGGKTTTVRLANPAANPLGSSSSVILDADLFTQYVDLDEDEIAETEKPMVSIGSISLDAENVIVGITELESDESSDYRAVYDYYGGAYGFTYNLVEVSDENVKASYMPNWDNVCIEVSDTNGFGRDYEFELAEYFGNIHDLGEGREKLYINAWEAGFVDGSLQIEDLDKILSHYYVGEDNETVPGRYFANIEIVQPYNEGANSISRMIASKAAGLLNPEDDSCLSYTYCYTDGSGVITSLILENPEERPFKTSTVNFKAELSFDTKGQPVVKVDPISAAAEKQMIYFDLSYDGYLAHELLWAFGGVNDRTYIVNTSDANATGTYIPMEHGVYLEIEEPDGFNLGGTYTLTRQPYLGNVDYDETGRRGLALYHWEMNEEGVYLTNTTQVVNILNQWKAAGEKFDIVEIFYEANPGKISYKVWNAMRTLLTSAEDAEIRIVFCNPIIIYNDDAENVILNGRDEKWIFRGTLNASKDFALNSNWDVSNNSISFGNVTFPAAEAYVGFWADSMAYEPDDDYDKQRYQTVDVIKNILGLDKESTDRYYALHLDDTVISSGFYGYYGEDDYSRWIYSGDIPVTGLDVNTVYEIKTPEKYVGDTYIDENGNLALAISQFALDYYGLSTDADEFNELIHEVLEARGTEKFHTVNVVYKENPGTISATTWNALYNQLNDDTDSQIIISGPDSEFHTNWIFTSPLEVMENTGVDVSADIGVNEELLQVNYDAGKFPAENVEVRYYVTSDTPEMMKFLNDSFGMSDSYFKNLSVIDATNNLMPNEIGAQLAKYEYDYGYQEFEIRISDAKALEGKSYTLKPYLGHIDEWTDDNGTEHNALSIHSGTAGKDEPLTEDELTEILAYHEAAGATYEIVRIEQQHEEGNNKIYPKVVRNAAKLLKLAENGQNYEGELAFTFWKANNYFANWILQNPSLDPIYYPYMEDLATVVEANIDANLDNRMILVNMSAETPDDKQEHAEITDVFSAEHIYLVMSLSTESAGGQYVKTVVEENEGNLSYVEKPEINVWGQMANDGRRVEIFTDLDGDGSNPYSTVRLGMTYTIGNADVYYGMVNPEAKSLYLNSEVIGKTAFDAADIKGIVDYYKSHQLVFDQIMVSQKSALSNTIKKELINSLREILNWEAVAEDSNYEVSIRFIFCNCEDNEDGLTVQNDQGWMLINPGVATADINANVTLTSSNANGVSVKLNKNTYNAKEVRVDYSGHAASPNGEKITAGIGEISDNPVIAGNNEVRLVALTKGTEVAKNVQSTYNIYEVLDGEGKGSRPYVDFVVGSAQNLTPGTVYTFEQYTEELGTLYVGDEFELPSDATWRLLNSDTASISLKDGKQILVPFNEGSVYVMKTYKEDGITKTEIQKGTIEVDVIGIVLDREGTVELEVGDYESVSVSAYPSVAGHLLNSDEIDWTYDSEILTLDEQEGCFTLIAIGEGSTTVTASYREGEFTDSFDINVRKALEYAVPKDVYALTNFDAKLSDIELPEGWAWKSPKTSLSAYKDLRSYKFTAVYTETLNDEAIESELEARTVEVDIEVAMLKLEAIDIVPVKYYSDDEGHVWLDISDEPIPSVLEHDQSMMLDYMFVLSNGGSILENSDPMRLKVRYDYFGINEVGEFINPAAQLKLKWTLPKNTTADIDGDTFTFTADSENAGKKTFTASLMNTKNNKVLFKDSIEVTVLKNTIADIEFIKEYSEYDSEQDVYIFRQPMENYYNLKFAISDTSVLKKMTVVSAKERYYNLRGETVWETRVQCTEGNPGFANITVTAEDELKSKIVFGFKVIDEMPKVMESAFELNKAFEGYYVPITIQFPDDAMPSWDPYIGVEEQYQDIFDVQYDADYNVDWVFDEDDNSYVRRVNARLVFNDKEAAKAKTYKNVILEVDTANDIKEVKINVKVIDKAPKVTIKQTKNINAFYKDMEGYEENLRNGLLTVSAPGLNVAYVDVYSEGFYTKEIEPGLYELCTENSNITKGTYTNVYVGYEVYNEQGAWYWNEAKLTVKVDEKAPSLVLSAKSDTLYPNYSAKESSVGLFDKSTGKMLELSQVAFVENRKKGLLTPIYGEETNITFAKNIFAVRADIEEDGWIDFRLQDGEWKNGTAKFTFDVKEESWNKPVSVSYSIKVNTAKPTLKLGSSKLTLNMDPEIAEYQRTTTTLTLNGFNNLDSVGGREVINENNVRFVGNDANATALLNNVITLKYDDYTEGIVAELHPNAGNFKTGNYKYKVFVTNEDTGFEASTTITVSIVNTTIAKSVKISKKGSIDVLRRDTTYIAYTPKFSNIAGKMSAVRLEGTDKDMFDVRLSEDESAIEIFAKDDKAYSTKVSYSVIPVVTMAYAIGEMDMVEYPVALPAQTIKVTQGKPKATITAPNGNVLYTQHGGNLTLDLAAVLGEENIEVENVSLLNYADDFEKEIWNSENRTINLRVSETGFNQINKTGKTWSLKFEVTYADKAVDQKPVTVTYKVTIK